VPRNADVKGFQVLPRRWVVERTFGWLTRCRRLARDYERKTAHAEAVIQVAMIRLMPPDWPARRSNPAARSKPRPRAD
jgi:transposase